MQRPSTLLWINYLTDRLWLGPCASFRRAGTSTCLLLAKFSFMFVITLPVLAFTSYIILPPLTFPFVICTTCVFLSRQICFRLFRILLLYHHPRLCRFLDQYQLQPELYATPWFLTLFSNSLDLPRLFEVKPTAPGRARWDVIALNVSPEDWLD